MGFSATVGIGSSSMKKRCSACFPFHNRYALGFTGIDLHPRPFDVVLQLFQESPGASLGGDEGGQVIHISPNGGGRGIRPGFISSPPATYREARMMTSIAIVKAKGEIVHPAMMPTSKACHAVSNSSIKRQSCMSWK